jgi:hypothetical protein
MNRAALVLLLTVAIPFAATPVLAQTAGPTPGEIVAKQQADQNRFQAQLQANQLQDLKRQNDVARQLPDPSLQAEAAARARDIQQQIDQNTALRQQMQTPSANPADVKARLQQDDARIQQLQQQQQVPLPVR